MCLESGTLKAHDDDDDDNDMTEVPPRFCMISGMSEDNLFVIVYLEW